MSEGVTYATFGDPAAGTSALCAWLRERGFRGLRYEIEGVQEDE